MAIQLMSNVKIITSGAKPTTANLLPGQAAFGKLTADGKYHLFGNTGEGGGAGKVVDIVLDTYSALDAATLETVLTSGNTTKLNIVFTDNEGVTKVTIGNTGITMGTTTMTAEGFKDNGKAVLSGNPSLVVTDEEAATMRTFLKVYSKTEIDGMVAGAFHFKGSVAAENLPTEGMKAGDVYNITTNAGKVKDIHNNVMKPGDNVVYVNANGDDPAGWDTLSGVVDLSAYYTSAQVDELLKAYVTTTVLNSKVDELNTAIADAKKAGTDAAAAAKTAQTTADTANTAAAAAQTTADKGVADAATAKTAADAAQADATANAGEITKLKNAGYQTAADVTKTLTDGHYVADENYVHTDNNYDDAAKANVAKAAKLVIDGDGTKVLKNDGSYDTLELSVVSI
jgi:hypothetical protein